MKISICIPQYNRIAFLMKSLHIISQQTYDAIEVVISDDGSTDATEATILDLQKTYRYPIIYKRNAVNLGYDRNLRQSIELASGDYCFILGNDDSFYDPTDMSFLADFLEANGYPDLGYANYVEEGDRSKVYERAVETKLLGSGPDLAMHQASNFSFVAGLIYKRERILKYNTDRFDGSIYAQIYLSCLMIASGCKVFSIQRPLVLKDLIVDVDRRDSYRDKIATKWKDMKVVDGGLPSVVNVMISAFSDAGALSQALIYRVFKRIYGTTYPHWLLDYRSNGALPEAVGMVRGLRPTRMNHIEKLHFFNRFRIWAVYSFSTLIGLLMPVGIFVKLKPALYKWLRKSVRK